MIYGYIRVSSDKQTVENQRFEINNFCEREKIKIDGWIEETISGTKAYDKRQLGKLLRQVQKDDRFFVAETSNGMDMSGLICGLSIPTTVSKESYHELT